MWSIGEEYNRINFLTLTLNMKLLHTETYNCRFVKYNNAWMGKVKNNTEKWNFWLGNAENVS